MNGKNLLRKLGGVVMAALIIFGVAMMSTSPAFARGGGGGGHGGGFHGGGFHTGVFIGPRFGYGYYGYPYGYYGYPYSYSSQYYFGSSQDAANQGYQDGLKTGSNDERRGKSYDPQRSHYFKDSGFGNFAQDFRDGFSRGYSVGFGR
jgi:hypothetical protein